MKKIVIAILILISFKAFSQTNTLSIDMAIGQALKNNASIKASQYELEARRQLQKTSFDLPKTDITLLYGQFNSYIKNDNNITVSQSIPFSAFGSQGALNRALTRSAELQNTVSGHEIVYQVKQVFYQLAYLKARHILLQRQDSIYEGFVRSASARYRTGETNLLEKSTAESQRNEAINKRHQNQSEIVKLRFQLKTLINSHDLPDIATVLMALEPDGIADTIAYKANPSLSYRRQQIEVARREKKLQAAKFAPGLMVGFFSQTLIGSPGSEIGSVATRSDRFSGFQVGVSLPLWFVPYQGRVRAAEFNMRATESKFDYYEQSLRSQLQQAIRQVSTHQQSLDYYTRSAIPNAALILKQSQTAFREGEIGYTEYLLGIQNAILIQENYFATLNDYNQSIIYIEYLTGKQ